MDNKKNLDIDDGVKEYFKQLKKYKPLTKENEKKLLIKYHNDGNMMARDLLIKSNLKYAYSIANNYRGRGVSLSELISEANNGLMDAIDKFDLSKDVKVITYAKWWILQRINNYILSVNKIKSDDLPNDYEKIDAIDDDYVIPSSYIIDSDIDEKNIDNDRKEYIKTILSSLTEREKDIINMYYGIEGSQYNLEEIGECYGLTKERIRQIIETSIKKIRTNALVIKQNY